MEDEGSLALGSGGISKEVPPPLCYEGHWVSACGCLQQ